MKSFEIRVGHSPNFGLPIVAILPCLCRKRRKAIYIHPEDGEMTLLSKHMIRKYNPGGLRPSTLPLGTTPDVVFFAVLDFSSARNDK